MPEEKDIDEVEVTDFDLKSPKDLEGADDELLEAIIPPVLDGEIADVVTPTDDEEDGELDFEASDDYDPY